MKVTSANSVFSIILNYITHKYVVSSKASEVRTNHYLLYSYYKTILQDRRRVRLSSFHSFIENDRVLVILADELDYLFTRNQHVIYKLFDWPNEKNSRLVVIVFSFLFFYLGHFKYN